MCTCACVARHVRAYGKPFVTKFGTLLTSTYKIRYASYFDPCTLRRRRRNGLCRRLAWASTWAVETSTLTWAMVTWAMETLTFWNVDLSGGDVGVWKSRHCNRFCRRLGWTSTWAVEFMTSTVYSYVAVMGYCTTEFCMCLIRKLTLIIYEWVVVYRQIFSMFHA